MSYSCNRLLTYCLLFSVLMTAGAVVAQGEQATSSGSTTTKTAVENSSKNSESKSNAKNKQTTKDEVAKDEETTKSGVTKDETVKDKVIVEIEDAKEKKTSVLRITVKQNGMNGLPIKNARVMVTHDAGKEYVVQTDEAGIVMLSDLPYGKIDVDVTSSGRKSDADTLVLDEPQETLTFQLSPRAPAE
jgi:phosphatidate phosphatase APP1